MCSRWALFVKSLYPLACFLCSWRLQIAGWIDRHCGFSGHSCIDSLAPLCSPAVLYKQQVSVVLLLAVCLAIIILLFLQWALSSTNNIVSRANLSTAFHLFFHKSVVNPLIASFKTLRVVDLLFSRLKRKCIGSVLIKRIVCSCFYICPMIQRLQHWIIWLSDHGAVRARYTSIIQQDLTPPVNIVLPPWA